MWKAKSQIEPSEKKYIKVPQEINFIMLWLIWLGLEFSLGNFEDKCFYNASALEVDNS